MKDPYPNSVFHTGAIPAGTARKIDPKPAVLNGS